MDRVQVLKRESAALGGDAADEQPWDAPIEPQEDAIEAAGVYVQDTSTRDESTLIDRSGDDLRFKDTNNPTPKTLTELVAGSGGLTELAHRTLRQLIHFISEGPAEGFASGAYRETTGTIQPSAEVWYVDATKAKRIVEKNTSWAGAVPSVEEWKVYDTDGTTVLATVTDTISYIGIFETSRTRAIV